MTKKHLIYITIAYFFAHTLLLFVNGIWWDDWIIFEANRDFIQWGYMMGRPEFGYIAMFINILPHAEVFVHILIFLFYYISTIFLYYILTEIDFLDDDACLFITILYATIYVNQARVISGSLPYAISNMLFFFTFYLFILWSKYLTNNSLRLFGRIVILLLFFLSFLTNSILVFYSILLIYIFYIEKTLMCYKKYIDFILLPIAFLLVKCFFWPTFGYYSGYNTIKLEGIKLAISQIPEGIWYTYTYPILESIPSHLKLFILLILISLVIVDRFLLKNKELTFNNDKYFETWNIFLGIFFIMVAIFPYLVIFSVQFFEGLNLNSFDTRHLLLTPLGIAWVTYFLFRYIFCNRKVLITALLIVISLNSIQWNKTYLIYELYWYKQSALIYLFRDDIFIRDNDTFVFTDINKITNNPFIYSFYSLAGMLKRSYGNERRLMDKIESSNLMQYSEYYNKDYLLGDYTGDYTKIDGTIFFESNLTLKDIPVLRYYDLLQSNLLETILRKTNSIKVVKNINN